jgi:hypothetical protein
MKKTLLPDPEILRTERIPLLTGMLEHMKRNIVFYNGKLSGQITPLERQFFQEQLTRMHNRKSRLERLIAESEQNKAHGKRVVHHVYVDLIPELCLIRLIHYLSSEDTRNLYLALSSEEQSSAEYLFMNELCNKLNLREFCDPCIDEYCNQVNCVRCYLNTKFKCASCNQPTLTPMIHCENEVTTSQGDKCKCNELFKCGCGTTYTKDMRSSVTRYLDRTCPCHIQQLGCKECVRECLWCANRGCVKDEHFKINPDPYASVTVNPIEWPVCEDCNRAHCCAAWIKDEWNYFQCPRWEN